MNLNYFAVDVKHLTYNRIHERLTAMKVKHDPKGKVPVTVRLERRLVTHLRDEAKRQRRTVTAVLAMCIEQTMKGESGATS